VLNDDFLVKRGVPTNGGSLARGQKGQLQLYGPPTEILSLHYASPKRLHYWPTKATETKKVRERRRLL